MLVLLIIVMLIAPLLQKGVDVKLPIAEYTTDKPETQGQSVIAIAADRRVFFNSVPIRNEDLTSKIAEVLQAKKDSIIIIKADEDVEYSAVMATMDALRSAGVEDMGLITEKKVGAGGN